MRYLCTPAKKIYAPMVTPDGACADEEQARTWADLRAPERGPWEVEALPNIPAHGVCPPPNEDEVAAKNARIIRDQIERDVLTNLDPDYYRRLRDIEEKGL